MQMIKKNKLTTKNIIIILSISMIFMFCIIMTKSYAIYKLQRDFNLMKSQIGTYKTGTIQ